MLKLISDNPAPQQPSEKAKRAAVIARAIMTESAPASFFSDDIPADWPPEESEP